ncbi:MAG: hypothetical protein NUV72_08465 [Bauldia sp.]|nr:hypothetical protein [Bauldia sp.]
MISAIPLTVIPLILFNAIGFAIGGDPWENILFAVPMVSGAAWNVTLFDLMILLAVVLLFFETLRSAQPARGATITNHIVSTILLIVYVVEFIVVPVAANSLFFALTIIALFDVVAGFSISIRTAQRDIALGRGLDGAV